MLRSAAFTILALLIAIGGGAWSVRLALDRDPAAEAEGWSAYPGSASSGGDPYENARLALTGVLPLGRAEGLSFVARRDASGAALSRRCAYRLAGSMPAARFWTLFAADSALKPLPPHGRRRAGTHSLAILHEPDGAIAVTIGAFPAAGNWLVLSGEGPFALVLTLYETPAAGGLAIGDLTLPAIRRETCDG